MKLEPAVQFPETDQLQPSAVRVDPKIFSIGNIRDMIAGGTLILPDVLRECYIWNLRLNARLIESILLRIPLHMFYFDEDASGVFRIVDGARRLFAICNFIDLGYPLADLEFLKEESDDRTFDKLDGYQQRRIISTQLSVQVIQPCVPRAEKLNIFRRVRFPELLSTLEVSERIRYLNLNG